MKLRKYVFAILLFLGILLCSNKVNAMTVQQLREKFPDGKYWNHYADYNKGHVGYGYNCAGSCNNPDGYTSTPCYVHGGTAPNGCADCNVFDGGVQCWGFARKLFYDYYGVLASSCGEHKDMNQLKPGDYVRYSGHSVWVIGMDNSNITVAECNWPSSQRCIIHWDRSIPKSTISAGLEHIIPAPHEINDNNYYKPEGSIVDLGRTFTAQIIPKYATSYAVSASGTSNGANVTIQSKNKNSNTQKWKFTRNSDGSYAIKNMNSNLFLDIYGTGNVNEENVQLWSGGTGDKQSWFIYTYNDGYRLVPRSSKNDLRALDVTDGKFTSGKNIAIYEAINSNNTAQTFTIEKFAPDGGTIQNIGTNFTAQIVPKYATSYAISATGTSNGSNVSLQSKNGNLNSQKWKFTRNSDGSYSIVNMNSNKALDINGTGNKDEENVQLWTKGSHNKQSWFIYTYNGGYRLVPRSSTTDFRALEVSDGKFTVGKNIQLYEEYSDNNKAQTFAIEKQYKLGDMNKDGKITPYDAFLVNSIYEAGRTPTEEELLIGDIDGNGKLTPNDAFRINVAYENGTELE